MSDLTYYERLKEDENYQEAIEETDSDIIDEIEKYMQFNFRYYQKEALLIFNYLSNIPKGGNEFKDELYESKFADGTIPFFGYEMATGSGKTLIIGALIMYLHKYYKYKDFLIITPATTVYDKTVENFDLNNRKRIFSSPNEFNFNVVTGNNFMDKSSDYDEDADFNIFILNIQKFFDKSENELKIDKVWEESYWEDNLGNKIAFRQYLKEKKLIIITDEAHHYQNFRVGRSKKSSGDIIIDLEPDLVIEFTATAIGVDDSSRRAQKLIYKYPINDFISDGYGKSIRAYGYTGSIDRGHRQSVSEDDKKKFFASYLIHLIKKSALMEIKFKPILLIRAREIAHADNLLDWILNNLGEEEDLIENTYNEITSGSNYEIITFIKKYISLEYFKEAIGILPEVSFVYHSENENDVEIKKKVNEIEVNNQEVLIQIKKLEEGWDIQNPYTILILSFNPDTIKTYIKQLIGRGVRLFREKRIYDGLTNVLKQQQEILHIICDKGSNFNRFVDEVREEMGLSPISFRGEQIETEKTNKTIATVEKFNDLYLPIIRSKSTMSFTTPELLNKIDFKGLQFKIYLERNTKLEGGSRYWEWEEDRAGEEKDVSSDIDLSRGRGEFSIENLILTQLEVKEIVTKIIVSQHLLPSTPKFRSNLTDAITELNNKDLKFKNKLIGSQGFYISNIKRSLIEFITDVIDNYFKIEFNINTALLKTCFKDEKVVFIQTEENGDFTNVKEKEGINLTREKVKDFLITGFEKSWFKYNWFESKQEYMLAYQLDLMDEVEFWIRNKRSYFYEYGINNKYHPDFVVKVGKTLYIIEVKGAGFLKGAWKSSRAYKELEILRGLSKQGYNTLFLLDKKIERNIFKRAINFSKCIENNYL